MKTSVILKIFISCFLSMLFFIFLPGVNSYAGDIGYIDLNRILAESQDALDVRDLLKLEEERYAIRLEKRKDGLKSGIDGVLRERHKASDYEYEEYSRRINEIKDDYQYMENLIELREVKLAQELFKKIIDVVKDAANKKGYRYVFELSESKIFFLNSKDDITDDVIEGMDKIHYDVRLLEDIKAKKDIYLRPDDQKMRKRELAEIDKDIVLMNKRHKEGNKDALSEVDKKESSTVAKAEPKTAKKKEKAVKEIKEPVATTVNVEPLLGKEEIKIPDWQKEIKEDRQTKRVFAKVVIPSRLMSQPLYDSPVLEEIEANKEVKIIEPAANYWYHVQTADGKDGYLFAVSFDKQITGIETVYIKFRVNVFIREKPDGEVIGRASQESVLLLEEDKEWAKIASPCCTGYVQKKFIRKR